MKRLKRELLQNSDEQVLSSFSKKKMKTEDDFHETDFILQAASGNELIKNVTEKKTLLQYLFSVSEG